jgi:hypothetical protein
MKSFNVVQFHRGMRSMAPGPRTAKNCAGGSCAPYWTAATQAVLSGLAAANARGRSGDVRRSWAAQSESGRRDLPEQFDFPPEFPGRAVSAGTRARSGGAPLVTQVSPTETRRHGEKVG